MSEQMANPGAQHRRARFALLAALLLVAGVVKMGLGVARPLFDVVRARLWVQVPLTSGDAEILPFHGEVHTKFKYGYEFNGSKYIGTRYAFVHPASFLSGSQLLDLQNGSGFPSTCYVNPAIPSQSVIRRDLPIQGYRLSCLVFLACGAVLLYWSRHPLRGWATHFPGATLRLLGCGFVLHGSYRMGRVIHDPVALFLHLILTAGPALALLSLRPTGLYVISFCLLCGACLVIGGAAFNPFAMGDLSTDRLHDPGYIIEHMITWSAVAVLMITLARLARFTAAARQLPPS